MIQMKIFIHTQIVRILIVSILFSAGLNCRTVETASMPRKFNLELIASDVKLYEVYIHSGARHPEEIFPVNQSLYEIDVPMMRGGYRQFIFFKYDKHLPDNYKIIQIKKSGKLIRQLSLSDIGKLPQKDDTVILSLNYEK